MSAKHRKCFAFYTLEEQVEISPYASAFKPVLRPVKGRHILFFEKLGFGAPKMGLFRKNCVERREFLSPAPHFPSCLYVVDEAGEALDFH